jgi:hypothetical protein
MGYATSNPPCKLVDSVGGGAAVWIYKSADDDSTVNGGSYITNATSLGMQVGDIVLVIDTATPKGSFHFVTSISSGAATLAFGAVS